MQMDRAKEAGIAVDLQQLGQGLASNEQAPLEERWIISRFNQCATDVNRALADSRFDDAANRIYQFFWGEFCDWYLEAVKIRLDFGEAANKTATTAALATLLGVFEASLRLLSPFMPFLTEEIWQALYDGKPFLRSIALSRCPKGQEHTDDVAEIDMLLVQELIITVRALRKDLGVEEKLAIPIRISRCPELKKQEEFVKRLARVSDVQIVESLPNPTNKRSTINFDVTILYEKSLDIPAERERLTKELVKCEKEMQSKQSQLHNEGFLAKAPAKIVDGLRTRTKELTVLIEKTRVALDSLDAVENR